MRNLCDNLERFVDGTLDDAEAEAFRMHLVDCSRCQNELVRLTQLEALSSVLAETKPELSPPARSPSRRPVWQLTTAGGAFFAAAVLVAVLLVHRGRSEENVLLENETARAIEPRVTLPALDRYRPRPPHMLGPEETARPLPLKALGQLEEDQKFRELALAYLVRGKPQDALDALKNAPPSVEVDNDRAAALIALKRYDEALKLLDPILAQRPDHPQALWNQALAFEGLRQTQRAAELFEKVARLNEPGWSDEATQRAKALRKDAAGEQKR